MHISASCNYDTIQRRSLSPQYVYQTMIVDRRENQWPSSSINNLYIYMNKNTYHPTHILVLFNSLPAFIPLQQISLVSKPTLDQLQLEADRLLFMKAN